MPSYASVLVDLAELAKLYFLSRPHHFHADVDLAECNLSTVQCTIYPQFVIPCTHNVVELNC